MPPSTATEPHRPPNREAVKLVNRFCLLTPAEPAPSRHIHRPRHRDPAGPSTNRGSDRHPARTCCLRPAAMDHHRLQPTAASRARSRKTASRSASFTIARPPITHHHTAAETAGMYGKGSLRTETAGCACALISRGSNDSSHNDDGEIRTGTASSLTIADWQVQTGPRMSFKFQCPSTGPKRGHKPQSKKRPSRSCLLAQRSYGTPLAAKTQAQADTHHVSRSRHAPGVRALVAFPELEGLQRALRVTLAIRQRVILEQVLSGSLSQVARAGHGNFFFFSPKPPGLVRRSRGGSSRTQGRPPQQAVECHRTRQPG